MLGEKGNLEGLEELDLPDDPVAPAPPSSTAGTVPDCEAVEANGIALLEDLRIGDRGVGHMGVDSGCTVVAIPGSGASTDGFVVAERGIPEEEIVHRALGTGLDAESLDECIDDALAGLHVPSDHRRGAGGVFVEFRVEEAGGQPDLDRGQHAFVEGNLALGPETENVENGALHDGRGGIEIPGMNFARSSEIDHQSRRLG